MRFTNIITTFALAASVSGWKIPENTQDGVYVVDTLEDGTEVHTKIAETADIDRSIPEDVLNMSPVPTSELEKRAPGQIWCGCGFDMNRGNCDAAVDDLKRQTVSKALAFAFRRKTLNVYRTVRPSVPTRLNTPFAVRLLLLHATAATAIGSCFLTTSRRSSVQSLAVVACILPVLGRLGMTTRRCLLAISVGAAM